MVTENAMRNVFQITVRVERNKYIRVESLDVLRTSYKNTKVEQSEFRLIYCVFLVVIILSIMETNYQLCQMLHNV